MATAPNAGQGTPFSKGRKIGQAIVKEISIVSQFPKTYRNREDITNLPPGVLVVGSQNILSNVSERLEVRKGYKMDGAQLFYIRTIAASSNALTLTSTLGLNTGDFVKLTVDSGLTGLTTGTSYYVIVVDSTTIKFATSNANALTGTVITVTGTPAALRVQHSSNSDSTGRL